MVNRISGGRDYIGLHKDSINTFSRIPNLQEDFGKCLMEPIYNPDINAGTSLEFKELQEEYKMAKRFEIKGTPLWVEFNPKGDGLLLCVPRGIPCEGHVQLFSAHTSNTPEGSFIIAELEANATYYKHLWGSLCSFMDDIGYGSGKDFREDIGALTCNWIIRKIAENAEKAYNEHSFS